MCARVRVCGCVCVCTCACACESVCVCGWVRQYQDKIPRKVGAQIVTDGFKTLVADIVPVHVDFAQCPVARQHLPCCVFVVTHSFICVCMCWPTHSCMCWPIHSFICLPINTRPLCTMCKDCAIHVPLRNVLLQSTPAVFRLVSSVFVPTHASIYMCMHIHLCINMFICIHVCMHSCLCVFACVFARLCVCMFACEYASMLAYM